MASVGLSVAVIGAGANTRLRHIPGLQAIEGVRVVAVCNRSALSGRRVADEFDIPRVEVDPEALFGDPAIDAICIGTWPYRHREYTVAALEAGKHVLCEARMAMDASEARAMLAASEARPDLVAQLVPGPFDLRSWRTIRRLVGDGALGELREVHVTVLSGGALDPSTPLHWREQSQFSGMNTMLIGIYAEIVQRWLGPTESVVADASTFVTSRVDAESEQRVDIDIPDSVGVLARMANGARATYRVSTVLHAARDTNGISLYGSAGTLHWSADDTMMFAPLGEPLHALPPDPGTEGEWNVEADFVTSIREGKPVELTSFADGLRYMQFTEAVWRSWHDGRAIRLDSV
jgi:predicted dehydrogenase